MAGHIICSKDHLSLSKDLLSMELLTAAKNALRYHFLSVFLVNGQLPGVSRQSRLLVDNHMILGAVHRSPGIYPTAEENPGKSQLGDHR